LNKKILGLQFFFTGILLTLGILSYWFTPADNRHSSEKLKINVNTASKEELTTVPYIGEKTALKIIQMRNKKRITDLKQLNHLRYYKKFKYYLKVE